MKNYRLPSLRLIKSIAPIASIASITFAALIAVSLLPVAHAEIRLAETIPLSPHLLHGQLANGLSYYIQKNSKPANKVELRLVVKAGSILEDEDQQGLAHFTEHMAFNGSRHFKGNELVSYLQSIGIKFGADLNAYTGFDETVYILPVPTDKKEHLEQGFLVLQDWANGLNFDAVEIDKERGVVLEESRRGKGANDRMSKLTLPKIFEGSRYAERLPIGKDEILKTFSHAALKRYYADWYRPNLMAVVVVGDIEPEQARSLVQRYFGDLKNPAQERARDYAGLPARSTTAAVVVSDKEATNNVVNITYSRLAERADGSFSIYRQRLIDNLFNAMLSQRLQDLTQVANPPFTAGFSGVRGLVRGVREYSAGALIGKAGPTAAINALVLENARVAQDGFTADEFERSKKNFLRGMERAYSERDKTESATHAAEFIRHFLSQEAIPGIEAEMRFATELVAGMKLEEITQVARNAIAGNGHQLVILQGNSDADFMRTSQSELLATVSAAGRLPLVHYSEKAVATSLMQQAPSGGKIVQEITNAAIGTTELVLGNGVRVILKPTDFKNDQVLMTASRFGGTGWFGLPDLYSSRYAGALVNGMGIGQFTPQEISKILAGKTARAGVQLSEQSDGFGGQSGSTDIETMLQLTYLMFTQPRQDPVLFQSIIGKQRDAVKNLQSNPEVRFSEANMQLLYGDHPRRPSVPKVEDFDKVDLERSMAIYRQRYGSAKEMVFFLVGSFELANIKPLIAQYLGGLPVGDLPLGIKDNGLRPVRGVHKKEVRGGTEAKSLISLTFTGDSVYSPEASLHLQALIEVLNIKLTEVLREKLNAVYSVRATGGLSKHPYGHYTVGLTIPCAPENVPLLLTAALAEMQTLKTAGPTSSDLDKVKQNWLKNHQEQMKTNGFWLNGLKSARELGLPPERVMEYAQRVNALQAADVQSAAATYFSLENFTQLVQYPQISTPATAAQ